MIRFCKRWISTDQFMEIPVSNDISAVHGSDWHLNMVHTLELTNKQT